MLAAMGTDVVADVLSALVAAGTLGLAGATFRRVGEQQSVRSVTRGRSSEGS